MRTLAPKRYARVLFLCIFRENDYFTLLLRYSLAEIPAIFLKMFEK